MPVKSRVSCISSEDFKIYVQDSETWSELLRKCGYNHPTNRTTIKKRIDLENIDTSHFKGCSWTKNRKKIYGYSSIYALLVSNSNYQTNCLKKRLISEGIFERICSSCHLREWQGGKIPIELDHINGDSRDHRIENLRLLCPNCHALTDTYKGKNVKRIQIQKSLNKCVDCQADIYQKATRCRSCAALQSNKRKVQVRPSLEILLQETKSTGFCATGRKYGVSDNTIRRWIRAYKK